MKGVQDHPIAAGMSAGNEQIARLPNHLKQYVVDQKHDLYTPIDHAVWRYIMRQNVSFLKKHAHRVYFQGLLSTGISMERIPSVQEMNDILAKIGWGAVAVDGFIPPAAFMEFQAHKVLVIACEMRQLHHIEYTPAPDIVHEAAGHAPIIVDPEYAEYLRRFGEVGAKAMSSRKDYELYEAIRHLSILKELPGADPEEVKTAEKDVEERQANLGEASEMALLSRLHWWTVEYGLVGTLELPKIYGAGLLSSIGESVSCLEDGVKKIPYSLETANYAFDITTQQPQLFVTPDFKSLSNVLEDFVSRMAFSVGGLEGLRKAIESSNVSTAVYSSGLQVTGILSEAKSNGDAQPHYVRTSGPTALSFGNTQLQGHDKEYHAEGFGSPVGRLKGIDIPLEDLSEDHLSKMNVETGKASVLVFDSGVTVKGKLVLIDRRDGKIILMTFEDCSVTEGEQVLFQPAWGTYDMAVGEKIVSVFSGAADKDAYDQISLVARERTVKVRPDGRRRTLEQLYGRVRGIREQDSGYRQLPGIWQTVQEDHHGDWLLPMEIVELLTRSGKNPVLESELRSDLTQLAKARPELSRLIEQGFQLITEDLEGEQ